MGEDIKNTASVNSPAPTTPEPVSLFRLSQPLLLIFAGTSLFLLTSGNWLAQWKINNWVLFAGNCILFLVTIASFRLSKKALFHNNVQAFLRMVYSGMFLKMGVCIGAVLIWFFASPATIGKIAVMCLFALYFLYTFTEVTLLMRLSKQKKNA